MTFERLEENVFARQHAIDNGGIQEFKIPTLQASTRLKSGEPVATKLGHLLGEDYWKNYPEKGRCLRMVPVRLGFESPRFCIRVDLGLIHI